MLSIGVAQIRNSTEVQKNFDSIIGFLNKFKNEDVDIVLFPECALSGCSANMKICTREFLSKYLSSVQTWVNDTGINVILPTAIVENGKVYNSVFLFRPGSSQEFFKVGLTPSEMKFFSVPADASKKILEINGIRLAILICREAQDESWHHFTKDEVDAILWPGYWGWTEEDEWTPILKTGEINSVMENMRSWQMPLIQSNFAFNDLEGYTGPGPIGRSVVINSENQLAYRGACNKEQGFIVELRKHDGRAVIFKCHNVIAE